METGELFSQLDKLEKEIEELSTFDQDDIKANRLRLQFGNFKKTFMAEMSNCVYRDSQVLGSRQKEDQDSATSLVANVSHEIRTPLNGIIGFIDLLNETSLNPTQVEIVNALTSASNGLMGIINELLEFSKLAAGHEKFEKLPFNLKNLIGELHFLSETLIVDKDIQLKMDIDKAVPANLVGDPSKLSQVLLNLLGNSIKFVESGQIILRVQLKSISKEEIRLGFSVEDTGIGISEGDLDRIFETYQQGTSNPTKYGGTGLGLSIVKQIVERMGGTIAVSSTLGKGTTFKFDLPFVYQENPRDLVFDNDTVDETDTDISDKKILVFEDNTLNQRLFQNQLNTWGCHVTLVDNGIEGLKLLDKNNFDLLLLDLRMPILNGFEIAKEIRKHSKESVRTTPILAISADITARDKTKCAQVGINDFLLKPYDSKILKEKIGNLIKNVGQATAIQPESNNLEVTGFGLIDLEPLFKECMGQVQLLDELVYLFKKNILEFIGEAKTHLQSRNFQGIDFAAHKVKSCLGMVKATELTQITNSMSAISKNGKNITELEILYEKFIALYPKTEQELDNKLNKLKQNA